jgi:hypothetical protein
MSKYQGQTDREKKIELSSSVEQVLWTKKIAPAGGIVGLDIYTHFVGNGSDLTIELSDQSGKKFGVYKEKICGNHFWAQIRIPENAKDALYAKAKLQKHNLEMKSSALIILPPVEISNAKWDKNEARRGDILKLTADVKGAQDGTEGEIEIWEHDSDGAHDFITEFPVIVKANKVEAEWEFQYYDDTDDIPTEEETEKGYNPPEYFFRVRVAEVFTDSRLLEFKDWIALILKDWKGFPLKNTEFKIIAADGKAYQSKTDKDGYARLEDMCPGKTEIVVPKHLETIVRKSAG